MLLELSRNRVHSVRRALTTQLNGIIEWSRIGRYEPLFFGWRIPLAVEPAS